MSAEMEDDDPIEAAFANAEEIVDPLDGLVERTQADTGEPFRPEVVEAIQDLKRRDRPAFERLRSQLKAAGCRMTALDKALVEVSLA